MNDFFLALHLVFWGRVGYLLLAFLVLLSIWIAYMLQNPPPKTRTRSMKFVWAVGPPLVVLILIFAVYGLLAYLFTGDGAKIAQGNASITVNASASMPQSAPSQPAVSSSGDLKNFILVENTSNEVLKIFNETLGTELLTMSPGSLNNRIIVDPTVTGGCVLLIKNLSGAIVARHDFSMRGAKNHYKWKVGNGPDDAQPLP